MSIKIELSENEAVFWGTKDSGVIQREEGIKKGNNGMNNEMKLKKKDYVFPIHCKRNK